ncbi:hypothetical protein DL770_009865 [Monosporascus sp. CRB-9-2]|nr:hypothetical protein DL770_009865 [Monosporascus sp. CRB-9-2]
MARGKSVYNIPVLSIPMGFIFFLMLGIGFTIEAIKFTHERFISSPVRTTKQIIYRVIQLISEYQRAMAAPLPVATAIGLADRLWFFCLETAVTDMIAFLLIIRVGSATKRMLDWVRLGIHAAAFLPLFSIPMSGRYMIGFVRAMIRYFYFTPLYVLLVGVWRMVVKEALVPERIREREWLGRENAVVYQPLDPGTRGLRILVLQPGNMGDAIACELEHTALGPPDPQFEALSYVWGAPHFGKRITVDGKPFGITENLYQALVHLRNTNKPRRLWVDAVCTNQIDIGERGRQVSLMGDIYHAADRVIIWLGPAGWGFEPLLRTCKEAATKDPIRHIRHYGSVRGVTAMLSTPWWTRIWVVQELLVAKSVHVQLGFASTPWDDFCQLVEAVAQHPCFLPGAETHLQEFHVLAKHRRTSAVQRQMAAPFDLLSLAYDFRRWHATDPKDKLYALLGLLSPEEDNGAISIRPTPNYNPGRSAADVSCEFAARSINRFRTLSILAMSECGKHPGPDEIAHEDLCGTWCPHWSGAPNEFPARPFWLGDGIIPPSERAVWQRAFSAAGGMPAVRCTSNTSDNDVDKRTPIRVRGWVRDAIEVVGTASLGSSLAITHLIPPEFEGQYETLGPGLTYRSVLGLYAARMRWRNLLNMWLRLAVEWGRRLGVAEGEVNRRFHRTVTAGVFDAYPAAFAAGGAGARKHGEERGEQEREYLRVTDEVCQGRNFFVTRTGLFGMGPAEVRAGQEVSVLFGCGVPVVLRNPEDLNSRHNRYDVGEASVLCKKYVGQAYVDEMMFYDGDVERDVESGKLEVVDMYLN